MHTIYHTEAIVVRSESAGEANKRIWLFTKELGLVIATVQGVRKPSAKLQSHIMDYSVIQADLIKGKSTWRLISAQVIDVPLQGKERTPLARAYARTVGFLERFLVGEGAHEELFDHILSAGEIVKGGADDARMFDALSLWKILVLLGYIPVDNNDQELFSLPLADATKRLDDGRVKSLIKNATEAITYSHL
ncbi:MAG TPA: recombination protein O N-terminal domain-containing protein [Candidatus Paceibacterota bacterium]|jgi:recombinational DNA repair protein (RecF pathway)|nr:recombination protein O N-terminal domain-containing protein [Candidatus Paceibacterota bacterium]